MAEPNVTHLHRNAAWSGLFSAGRCAALGLLCLSLASSTGCRHIDNAQVDVLESELRKQEDYIYELEEYLVEYSEKLREARAMQCETVISTSPSSTPARKEPTIDTDAVRRPTLPMNGRNKLSAPKASLPAPPATTDAPLAGEEIPAGPGGTPATPAGTGVEVEELEIEEVNPEELEAPALEIGPGVHMTPRQRSVEVAANQRSASDGPLLIPDPIDYQADGDDATAMITAQPAPPTFDPAAEAASELATAEPTLPLNEPVLAAPQQNGQRLTADHLQIRRIFAEQDEAKTGPLQSLLIVVEALNSTEEPVGAEGEASMMIMATDETGVMRAVERWDFTAAETASAWQSSHLGDGLHLELPMKKGPLPEGNLELWARVVAADGRKLLTKAPLTPSELVSVNDFVPEAGLAAAQAEPAPLTPVAMPEEPNVNAAPEPMQVAAAPVTKASAEAGPKTAWRASTVRLNENRVASTAVEGSHGEPSWKRSSTAAASGDAKRDWAPFR
ncbi:hypothetical protein [Lacipirellula parvula]|uniref:Uncharacterized protein n=1 Tax=Lacipirellula parvula TaxID=2650471 RepID=A0A5K7X4I9_9BACT|nr:hypothetical protein [Lacipirellula parvula]BBO31460.1 hypothetical protein PLANPX_1072 [Lacipirellula parvula]